MSLLGSELLVLRQTALYLPIAHFFSNSKSALKILRSKSIKFCSNFSKFLWEIFELHLVFNVKHKRLRKFLSENAKLLQLRTTSILSSRNWVSANNDMHISSYLLCKCNNRECYIVDSIAEICKTGWICIFCSISYKVPVECENERILLKSWNVQQISQKVDNFLQK